MGGPGIGDETGPRALPQFDRFELDSTGGAVGQVVSSSSENLLFGNGNIIHTDLGLASGVQPGDVLTLYRPNGDLPRQNLGQAVVLTVEPGTSTVKVTRALREMEIGDYVEVNRTR